MSPITRSAYFIRNKSNTDNKIIFEACCKLNETCAICLENIQNKSVYHTPCKHTYHTECLRTQISNSSCPTPYNCAICRNNLYHIIQSHDDLNKYIFTSNISTNDLLLYYNFVEASTYNNSNNLIYFQYPDRHFLLPYNDVQLNITIDTSNNYLFDNDDNMEENNFLIDDDLINEFYREFHNIENIDDI